MGYNAFVCSDPIGEVVLFELNFGTLQFNLRTNAPYKKNASK
jgi:hypothetical protein